MQSINRLEWIAHAVMKTTQAWSHRILFILNLRVLNVQSEKTGKKI